MFSFVKQPLAVLCMAVLALMLGAPNAAFAQSPLVITNTDNVSDDATLQLRGARFVTTALIGGMTYLFVAGEFDSGVSVFLVANDGTLSNVDNVTDDATLKLFGAASVTTALIGGTTYLFASGYIDDGVSVFVVANDGMLTNVDNVTDDAILKLNGAFSVTTAVVSGTTYLFVAGQGDSGVSVFSVTAPEIDVTGGLGPSIADGDTTPDTVDLTDFGTFSVGSMLNHTFLIKNFGTAPLNLTGSPRISIGGTHAGDFTLVQDAVTPIATGDFTLFIIGFNPNVLGLRTATISIANDDADENPYTFAISGMGVGVPEMDITGNGVSIVAGDTTPDVADLTDFGNLPLSLSTRTFNYFITNSGTAPLNLTGAPRVSITGANAGDFTLIGTPDTPVSAIGGLSFFDIRFDPSGVGLRTATVSIANDDPDENPYTFDIQGNGVGLPEMDVTGLGVSIADDDTTPDVADDTGFGNVALASGGSAHTFTVTNSCNIVLNLTGSPRVSISGANAIDFTLAQDATTPVAAGGITTFTITFDPTALGLRTATVSIANDDADENPYNFNISGTGTNAPPTGEFLVNTTTSSNQIQPGVATLANGDFVIAWADESATGGDTSSFAIRAQRFDSTGLALGTEFLVNTTITDLQASPSAAALANGGFVITWQDNSVSADDPSLFAVRAQRYDAAGMAQGGEFLVNTTTLSLQQGPSVAGLTGGGFVIAWWDFSRASGPLNAVDIRAQRYDATGAAQGVEFVANTTLANNQISPSVAALPGDGFIIAWKDDSASSGGLVNWVVRAQRFGAGGVPQGAEFPVNTNTSMDQQIPGVAVLPGGGFVITWQDNDNSGGTGNIEIRAQRFGATGTKTGPELLVNTITTGVQLRPSVSSFANGDFVVTWQDDSASSGDLSGPAVRAQSFKASGVPLGSEILVNTATLNDQIMPKVAALQGGRFVITWQDNSQSGGDPDGNAIRAHIFDLPAPEMDVVGLGQTILDGDATPDVNDGSEFGQVALSSGSVDHSFTINNSGNGSLNFLSSPVVQILGPNGSDFTVIQDATNPVSAYGSTNFTIRFDPTATGLRIAFIAIFSNDADESPYSFTIQGTGIAPEMDVIGGSGIPIADGDTTPDTADLTDFGNTPLSLSTRTSNYFINNSGTMPLNLTGMPRVVISGANAGDFTLIGNPSTPVPVAGGQTFFDIRFDPSALGLRTATISIANDDANENPYTFDIQGNGTNTPPTGTVIITGTPTQGQTLTADTSGVADVDGLGPFNYQWRRNNTNIAGATNATYVLVQADVGFTLNVVVSYTDGGGTVENVISAHTDIVQALPQFTLEVSKSGLGSGTITSAPAGINCGTDCSEGYAAGTSVTLTPLAVASGSVFKFWNGACTGNGACVVTMDQARNVGARFERTGLPNIDLFSSLLPSARSGSNGSGMDNPEGVSRPTALGDPITVFASVINASDNPAQNCQITIPANAPVTLSYQETDAANAPVGPADAPFDVDVGQTRSFILAFTPTALTAGIDLFPDFACENANVDAIPGVNTVFLSIDDKEVPDILSIGVTPSGDGIINVPLGSTGFMTASAINIGVGDSAGSADTAVMVTADTGAAALPLLVQICETDAASACITPLGAAPIDTVIGDTPSFFAAFASDQSGGIGIALDPANARVFLRFTDVTGTTRSVTSVAVTVPAAADAPVAVAGDLPIGRWAVMVRKTTGIRHVQEPGTLYIWSDSTATLETARQSFSLNLFAASEGAFTGLEAKGVIAGQFVPARSLFMVSQRQNTRLDIWGVHDIRGLDE